MVQFRFMTLDIWKEAMVLNDIHYDLADMLEHIKHFRAAEQLRAASLSISNNIAEGSGSFSDRDFANFLNYSHRSAFECANILCLLFKRKMINEEQLNKHLTELDVLCRKITNFRKRLI